VERIPVRKSPQTSEPPGPDPKLPDLSIKEITYEILETPEVEDTVCVSFTVKNICPGTSPPSNVNLKISGGSFNDYDHWVIPALASGDVFTKTWCYDIPDGRYQVTVEADYDYLVPECDEINNKRIITFVK